MCSHESHLPEDRLSSLPDDILLFILSFLTFKEVVKTSLFSRRWLNLWIHTPVVHFHAPVQKDYLINDGERKNYVKWVNRVLLRHKGQSFKEFKIVCALDKRNQKDIDNWLVVAFARKVQCLELNLSIPRHGACNLRDNYVFPGPFLSYSGKSQFLQFDFMCLKSLSLKRVEVTGEGINFFLLNCPFLERLEVVGSSMLVNLVISDPALVLKYLKIKYCPNLEVLSISNLNLVSLDLSSVNNLTLRGLPMLVELFISGSFDILSRSIAQASSCFPQLEALTLSGSYLKDVTQLSKYGQLTKLKRLVIMVDANGDESLTKLISIVNSCPHLKEFVLMLVWFKPERTRRPIFEPERTRRPICKVKRCSSSLKRLKVFEFMGYYGRFSDVELIMDVVKNAVGLEKIIIDPRNGHLIGLNRPRSCLEEEARSIALQQYDPLRGSIPAHVHLLIR